MWDSLLSCCGVRGEVVRDCLNNLTGWKKRLGYGQRWVNNLMLGLSDVQSFCGRHEVRKPWCEEFGKR